MEKLLEVISFILQKSPNGRDRLSLSKLIYYADGVYFQKNAKLITNQTYIHLEDSPCALDFQSALLHLRKNGLIDIQPKLTEKGISGFQIVWTGEPGEEVIDLNRQEKESFVKSWKTSKVRFMTKVGYTRIYTKTTSFPRFLRKFRSAWTL